MRVTAIVALFLVVLSLGMQRGSDALEASLRLLRQAVTYQPDGSHHALLISLRSLRDPELKPMFYKLAEGDHWSIQIDGILGLGEIESPPRIDPWLISRLKGESDQTLAIRYALGMEMVTIAQIREMLQWEDLDALARVLLMAESVKLGEPPAADQITPLTTDRREEIAGLASCLLLEIGDASALKSFEARLAELSKRDREAVLFELFRAIDQFALDKSADFIVKQLSAPDLEASTTESGVAALLALAPEKGVQVWSAALKNKPSQAQLVRYGILLLLEASKVPPAAFKALRTGDTLLERMADVGMAIAEGKEYGDDLFALMELGHPPTSAWAMEQARKLPSSDASRLYQRLIDRVEIDEPGRGQRATLAIDAANRLMDIDPEAMIERMKTIEDDSLTQEAVLVGLLNSRSPRAAEAGLLVKRLGSGRADSMALVLIARHSEKLSAEDLQQLGRVASGGGKVDSAVQILAAWLFIKHSGRTEQALTQLFATS